jgi:hypothetical protein
MAMCNKYPTYWWLLTLLVLQMCHMWCVVDTANVTLHAGMSMGPGCDQADEILVKELFGTLRLYSTLNS